MYNSLKYTQELEAAGFNRDQAEATVKLVMETMDQHFATKEDVKDLRGDLQLAKFELRQEIQTVRNELKTEIQTVRNELKTEIQEVRTDMKLMESRLTIRLGGLMVTCMVLLGTFLKLN